MQFLKDKCIICFHPSAVGQLTLQYRFRHRKKRKTRNNKVKVKSRGSEVKQSELEVKMGSINSDYSAMLKNL
jgi:hypothetical protein